MCVSQLLTLSSWTQEHGDAATTSYVPFKGIIEQGWMYKSIAEREENPCTTEDGTVFVPLQSKAVATSFEVCALRGYDV